MHYDGFALDELEPRIRVDVDRNELPSAGLLSFYDRLRERVMRAVEGRSGRPGRTAADLLLVAPDLFILLARLALDRRVPASSRRLIIGAVVYFLTPVDLLPEGLVGPVGFLEDAVLAVAVLETALGANSELAQSHWSGARALGEILRDTSRAAHHLLGADLYRRFQRLLASRGLRI